MDLKRVMTRIVKMILGCFLFAGLPIIGWGILDISAFFRHPVRLSYIVIVVILQIIIILIDPEIGRQGKTGNKLIERQRMAVVFLQILSIAIMIAAPFCDRRDIAVLSSFELGRYLGLVVFTFGFITMNWAEIALGKQFSIQVTVQENHQLITNGLYKHVRNPRYLGMIAHHIGIAFIFRSWLSLLLVLLLIAVLMWRIHDEEKMMEDEFGKQWESYKKRTWRLLPFLF